MRRKTNYWFYGKTVAGILFFLNSFFLFSEEKDTTSLKLKEVEVFTEVISNIKTTAVPTQQISQKDINREGIQSMADAVRRFAGVVVKDYGGIGGLKTVSIRGFGAQHTAVSLDGITISDAQSGQIDIGRYSLDNVSLISLEIGQPDNIFQPARNFASVGILSIISQSPFFSTDKSYLGSVQLKAGSFGQFDPSFYIAKKLKNNYALSLNGEWQRADGNYPFDFDNGASIEHRKRYNSDVNILRLEANLYKQLGCKGNLSWKTNYYDADRGLPGTTVSLDTYAKERLLTKVFFSQLNAIYKLNDCFSWRAAGKFTFNKERYSDKLAEYEDSLWIDNYRQYEYYATTTLLYQPSSLWQFSLAQDYIHNHLYTFFHDSGLDKEVYPQKIKAYRNSSITALNAKYAYNQFLLQAGLLGGYYGERVNKGARPKDKKRISPSLSVDYALSEDWHIRTSYKDIYRVPTFNDMYYTQIGNRALDPEIARQFDLGAVFKKNCQQPAQNYALSADVYYNKVKNKIVATPTMFVWKMKNVDNVRILGADVKADYNIRLNDTFNLFVNGSYSYQDAENTDSKQQIIYTPKHSGNISVSLENPCVNASYSIIGCSSQWTAEYHSVLNKVDAYTDHSLSFNKTVEIRKRPLRLQIDLLNLLNKNYEIIKNYPMPGRSFMASGLWNF